MTSHEPQITSFVFPFLYYYFLCSKRELFNIYTPTSDFSGGNGCARLFQLCRRYFMGRSRRCLIMVHN
jgi:hypothetical protein